MTEQVAERENPRRRAVLLSAHVLTTGLKPPNYSLIGSAYSLTFMKTSSEAWGVCDLSNMNVSEDTHTHPHILILL